MGFLRIIGRVGYQLGPGPGWRRLGCLCCIRKFDRATFHTAHIPHPGLGGQFLQQRLGLLEVGGVEAFGEPVVDFGQRGVRLVAAIGITQ